MEEAPPPTALDMGQPAPDAAEDPAAKAERERLVALIERHGPIMFLHPEERFAPTSAEWFLVRSSLYQGDRLIKKSPTAQDLPLAGEGYYLTLPEADRPGDLKDAIAYVHPFVRDTTTDLQFWFFYPYNGPGTFLLGTPLKDYNVDLSPFGEHTGDWEHVTLRINNQTQLIEKMYLSQHGDGEWVAAPDIEKDAGHPVFYSSKNGHAAYRKAGSNLSESGSGAGFSYGLRNDTARGAKLDCSKRYRLVGDKEAPMTFVGRWGPMVDNAPFVTQVAEKVPVIGRPIAETTLAKERISNGPSSPANKDAWVGKE